MGKVLNTVFIAVTLLVFGIFVIGCTYSSQNHVDNNFTGLRAAMTSRTAQDLQDVIGIRVKLRSGADLAAS